MLADARAVAQLSGMTPKDLYPSYSAGELRADRLVHLAGLGAGAAGVAVLLVWGAVSGAGTGNATAPAVLAVYGAGLVAMLGFSAWYNLDRRPAWRGWLRRADHAAIYAMIAGTYTPFAVYVLPGARGATLLAVVWGVAAAGMVLKLAAPRRLEGLSIVAYLALGWAVVAVAGPFVAAASTATLALLFAGGVLYTAGVAIHLWRGLPYQNAIWHAAVLAAAGCHYAAVVDTVLLA